MRLQDNCLSGEQTKAAKVAKAVKGRSCTCISSPETEVNCLWNPMRGRVDLAASSMDGSWRDSWLIETRPAEDSSADQPGECRRGGWQQD